MPNPKSLRIITLLLLLLLMMMMTVNGMQADELLRMIYEMNYQLDAIEHLFI